MMEYGVKPKCDDFLTYVGLRRDTKLTLNDVKVVKIYSSTQAEKADIVFQFFTQLHAEDPQVVNKLYTSVTSQQTNNFSHISKRDVLFAILNCCDPLLMQYVLHKLNKLGSAVPILMPSVDNGEVYFLQWGLRPCFQHHALLNSETTLSTYNFISVSAFRFDDLDFSKSDVLNKLLANLQHNDEWTCFASSSEDPKQTVWSDGTLEVTWCTFNQELTTPSVPSFLLLNLRGDGHQYARQRRFCTSVSQIQIVFLSQFSDDNVEYIYTMTETSNVIAVTNKATPEEIKAFDKLTVIHCQGLPSQEISNLLSESLVEKINATSKSLKSSVKDLTDACITLNFIDDEQNFQRAKRLAEEIVADIPYDLQDYKEQILQLTKSCSGFNKLSDPVDDTCSQDKKDQCSHEAEHTHVEKMLQFFTFDKYVQQIFLTYLHLCLQQKLCKRLQLCTDMYMRYYEKIKNLPISSMNTEQSKEMKRGKDICLSEEHLVRELNENSLKVEHFLFVLWCHLRKSYSKIDNYFNSYTYDECIKLWLMNGNSFDLVNFDSCQMPSPWALELLHTLQSLEKDDTRVRVVSAFGGNGVHSCSLLNRVFGTNFTKTENLCSGGLKLQLMPIQNTSASMDIDFLVFLDINVTSLAEVILESYSEMRENLLILMSSITDVLLIALNEGGLRAEESIMFDMIVHTVLKFESSVVNKCCVIYDVLNSECPNLKELQSNTLRILEESCGKVHEKESNSNIETYFERSPFREEILSYFSNEGTINVKVLPNVQRLSSYQDYVNDIRDIKQYIILLLQQCQREARTLRELSQVISSQSRNAWSESNPLLYTPVHKYVHPSFKIHYYYVNNIEKITQKISHAIVTASMTLAKADNPREKYFGLKADMSKLVHTEVEKVREFLVLAGKNNILSDKCNDLIAKLLKYETELLHYSSKEMQQAVEVARENDAIDYVVKIKTSEVLATIKAIQEGEGELLSVKEHLEIHIKEYINDIKEEYPQTPILEIKSRIKLRVTDALKRTKYGNHVHTLIDTTVLDNWASSVESINSIDDVKKLEKKFNIKDKRVATVFLQCERRLSELSTDYVNFTINSEEVVGLLKRCLQSFQNTVDSLTMCIFLCSKFIFSTHRHHARADVKSRHLSANEIYFEDYIVKNAEPLNFPSLKSKFAYIVPRFATLLPSDDFSDLAKTFRSRSVTNYNHIPFNLITIQRLDRHFLWFLPVTSSQNVNSILHVVNDAKLYCLGTALSNSVYDFDGLFDNIFNMIKHSLINGKDSEAIRAAAFVHVCAWSSPLLSVKEYEKDSTTNVAYRALKVVPILKLNILFVKQPLEKEFAQIVRDAVEDALLKCIPQELQNKVREFLLQRSHVILLKRSLIGRMLRLFCNEDNFQELLSFVEDYDHCSRKYILLFLVTQINEETNSFIWKLKANVIEENIKSAIRAVKQATLHCVETGNYSLSAWLQTFEMNFVSLNDNRLEYLEKHLQFSDVDLFAEHCCSILGSMKHSLNDRIDLPEKGNIDSTKTFLFSLSRNMHEEISSNIIGCIEQCPLCGNVCKFDLENHEYHSVLPHIPVGIKGGRDRESDELIPLSCPSLVSENNIFTSLDLEDDEISKLSTFMRSIHPKWHVQDAENDPDVFWKYIFNRFNRQFAEFYECREGKLPPEWKEYSKEDAIRSVERTYKLEQNEFMSH